MKTFTCECGCRQTGPITQRTFVRRTDGPPRRQGARIFRRALSWQVLKSCEKPFVHELRAAQRCHATAQALTFLPRWRRILKLPRLWQLRRLSLRRRIGDKAAKRRAWLLILTTAAARRISVSASPKPAPASATETPSG